MGRKLQSLLPFLAASALAFTGCATVVRSTSAAPTPYPQDGTHMLYSRDGRLMQKTIWRDGRLLSASERDETGRWTCVVISGAGALRYFDWDGHEIGFAEYHRGEYVRGAH